MAAFAKELAPLSSRWGHWATWPAGADARQG
jgi:hypothetical protein